MKRKHSSHDGGPPGGADTPSRCSNTRRVFPSSRMLHSHVKRSTREIKSSKINFCLGCLSCFVVVFVVALMNSLLGNAPIVFLRLAELTSGEIDVGLTADHRSGYGLLNYTHISEAVSSDTSYDFLSPRQYGTAAVMVSTSCDIHDPTNLTQRYLVGIYDNAFNSTTARLEWNATHPENEPFVYDHTCKGNGNVFIEDCLYEHCGKNGLLLPFMAIDTKLERKASIGEAWPYGEIPPNKAILHQSFASQLGLGVGDHVYVAIELGAMFTGLSDDILFSGFQNRSSVLDDHGYIKRTGWDSVILYVEIMDIYDDPMGKTDQDKKYIIMEYGSLITSMAEQLSPIMPRNISSLWAEVNHYHYAGEVYLNMKDRHDVYLQTDFDAIQEDVVRFASTISYQLGVGYVDTHLPVLNRLQLTRFLALFLGLVLNIVVIVLLALSVLLIYSLLMVNVETRTFELGVLRMIGMNRTSIVHMLLIQAFVYALPSILLGLPAAQLGMIVLAQVFVGIAGVSISPYLEFWSVVMAIAMGIFVPVLSSIVPIWTALTSNLRDSLDTKRAKVQAVQVKLERSEDSSFSLSLLLLGSAFALFGFGVYYVFPLALMTFSLSLLLDMFFFLLLAMMLGLVILSLNLQHLLERLIITCVLFWETKSVRTMTSKNLVGHRRRNRKTTVMYALALGFIIFIVVSYRSSIAGFLFKVQQTHGCYYQIEYHNSQVDQRLSDVEKVLNTSEVVVDFAYKTPYITELMPYISDFQPRLRNEGRSRSFQNFMWAVSPNFFDVVLPEFIIPKESPGYVDGMTLTEQLYTAEGSGKAIIGALYSEFLGLDLDTPMVYTFEQKNYTMHEEWFYLMKPLALLSLAPGGLFSDFPAQLNQDAIISIPAYARLSKHNFTSLKDVPQSRVKVLLDVPPPPYDSNAKHRVKKLTHEIEGILDASLASVWDYNELMGPVNTANNLLMYFFGFITVIAMGIASFSLFSSMYTNVYEQQQEIGVLRAVGANKNWITRVYIYESFTLVLSSSLLGTVIGTVVSYSLNLQRALITQLPIPFVFPWEITVLTFIASMLLAFVASLVPTRYLLNKSTTALMR